MKSEILIYQNAENQTAIEVQFDGETVWLNQYQLADLFQTDRTSIVKHLQNIYATEELSEVDTCAKIAQVRQEGKKQVRREVLHYNLDAILSVGYRVNSKQGTKFRQWATARLKDYLVKGFAINQSRIVENQTLFLKTLDDLQLLSANSQQIKASEVVALIKAFQHTWFSLDRYDKNNFPLKGTQKEVAITAAELFVDLQTLKTQLIKKGEATELFAQEKQSGNLEGIFGNVFQTVFGEDAYPSIEEKAANLLYFIIKNHPFNDGNKRSGAFAFIWFLQKAGLIFKDKIHPETLVTLTILIAESNPTDKEKVIGLILLILTQER